jgi:hypothetical protein
VAAAYFAVTGVFGWLDTFDVIANNPRFRPAIADFAVFQGGARLLTDGHFDLLYDFRAANDLYDARYGGPIFPGPYLNPPAMSFFFLPLAGEPVDRGFDVFAIVNVVLLVLIGLSALAFTRSRWKIAVVLLAVGSFRPAMEAVVFGQVGVLLAFVTAIAGVLLVAGREPWAGAALAVLVVKPQFAVFHALALLWRGLRRAWLPFALVALALGAAPFLLVGIDSIGQYRELLAKSAEDAFRFRGQFTIGASAMFGWNGFLARLQEASPNVAALGLLWAATAAAMLWVWQKGDASLAFAASVLGALLIMPHGLGYDWPLLLPAALLLAFRGGPGETRAVTLVLLFAIHVATWDSVGRIGLLESRGVLWATPAAFLLLLWLCALPALEGRLPGAEAEAGPPVLALPGAAVALRWFRTEPRRAIGRALLVLALLSMAGFMVKETVRLGVRSAAAIDEAVSDPGPPRLRNADDFTVFLAAATLIREGDAAKIYDPSVIAPAILTVQGESPASIRAILEGGREPLLRYYNPPAWALLTLPLTYIRDVHAYRVAVGVNLAAVLLTVILCGRILGWHRLVWPLLALAVLSYDPTHATVRGGQQSILLGLAFGLAWLCVFTGRYRWAGVLLAPLVVKPQFLVLNGPVAFLKERRIWISAIVAGLVVLAPFLLAGLDGIRDYFDVLRERERLDTTERSFTWLLLSWPGFWSALIGDPVSRGVIVVMQVISFVPLVLVVWKGPREFLPLAGSLATLIIVSHSHPQDWFLLVPGAAFLLSRRAPLAMMATSAGLLFLVYLGTNTWGDAQLVARTGGRAFFLATPAAFLLLAWLAALPFLEARYPSLRPPAADAASAA